MQHAIALLTLAVGCGPRVADLDLHSGSATLHVRARPFGLELRRGSTTVARTLEPAFELGTVAQADPRLFPEAFADPPVAAYRPLTDVIAATAVGEGQRLTVATADPRHTVLVTLRAAGEEGFAFSLAPMPAGDPTIVHVRMHLAAAPDEHYFGLGEYFDTFDHRGLRRDVRFAVDTGIESGYNEAHVPVPSWVSTTGFAILLENREPTAVDFASADAGVHLTAVAGTMAGHVIAGADPVAAVARVQRIAGLPPLWPPWVFAPQQWRNEVNVECSVPCEMGCRATRTGQDLVLEDARAMRQHRLPGSVLWIDAPWMTAFCDFQFNPVQFPSARGMIDELHRLGYHVVVWAAPFINESDDRANQCGILPPPSGGLYTEAKSKGYFVKQANGQPVLFPWRGSSGGLIDFSNPEAFAFWKSLVKRTTDLGVVGYKLDWDEYIVAAIGAQRPDFRFFDGGTAATHHAIQHELFHQAHHEALVEAGGPGFVIARSGTATDARYATAVWPGDLDNGFERHREQRGGAVHPGGLPAAVNAAVSLAASAHPHFGSDIGGFRHGLPTKEALARWIELGALSTVMQLGGGGESHNVWDFSLPGFDQELLDLYRVYARLHTSLFPYLYSYVKRNSEDGTPILRAPGLMAPGEPEVLAARYQYFFGEHLLVAPVVVDGARARDVTLPRGRWIDFWTREIVDGGATRSVAAPLDRLPLFVRAGAILPLLAGDVDTLAPASDPSVVTLERRADRMELAVYPEGTSAFTVYDGTRLGSAVSGGALTLSIAGAPRPRTYTARILWPLVASKAPAEAARTGTPIAFVGDLAALDAAPEGAFHDPATGLLHLKLRGEGEVTIR